METPILNFKTSKIERSDCETKSSSNTPSQKHRVRKSSAGKRKIQHEWVEKETKALIAAVENRPVLWNGGSGEYTCSRLDAWREVLDELNIEDVDVNEAKTKWLALRASFKINLQKLRKRQVKQGTLNAQTVNWRHFKQMLFLDVNTVQKSTKSASSKESASVVADSPILVEHSDSLQSLATSLEVSQRNECRSRQLSPKLHIVSATPHVSSSPTSEEAALHTSDPNSTFCDHILAELRTLSKGKARNLRRLLMQVMFDFMDVSEAQQSQTFPMQTTDESNMSVDNVMTIQQNVKFETRM